MLTPKLKALVVAVIAAFFTLIVFNNVTDYETNLLCVQSVLGMEGIQIRNVLWRAIESPGIITAVYVLIIVTEAIIAFLCWLAAILLFSGQGGKLWATLGLTLGFSLFMFGFVAIGGEWFYMWQHPTFAGLQQKAAIFALVMLGSLLFVTSKD